MPLPAPATPSLPAEALDTAAPLAAVSASAEPAPGPRLLLVVMADGQGPELVAQAARLQALHGGRWTVLGLDTPETALRPAALRDSLREALDQAGILGAEVARASLGTSSTSAVVQAVVHRVQSERADLLVIGRSPLGGLAGLEPSQRLSHFTDVFADLLPGVAVHVIAPARVRRAGPPGRRPGAPLAWRRRAGDLLLVAAALLLATAAGFALLHVVPADSLVMVYMVAVVFAATNRGPFAAVAAVVGSIFLFSLCFVEPRWSFRPIEPRYWLVFAVMLVVGLVIGQLAARGRQQAAMAEARALRAHALSHLSQQLAGARSEAAVQAALEASLRRALQARACVLTDRQLETAECPAEARALGARLETLRETLREAAEVPSFGSTGPRCIPLCTESTALGVAVVEPLPPERDTLEDRHLARALCDQAALALERARFEQRSAASALETERERVRNTLLAGISHDFRTPLTTIMGTATTLLDQGAALAPARQQALLRDLLAEAERLHLLSSNLLDLTRIEEGAVQPVPEWCPADELVAEALALLGPRAQGRRIETAVPPDLAVWCDPRLVGQVLVNLLDNALRHTPAGAAVRLAVSAAEGEWFLVVHDAGPGVPAGQEEAVFERFHRAGPRGDDRGKGLGLAICAAVAQLHGGRIGVRNEGGARFEMRLPQPPAPEPSDWGDFA